jgi:galactose mutarotase-like enzyme
MPAQPFLVSITSAALRADISTLGAELFALRDCDGRDLQWNGDPAVWKGRAPILFPIVGALNENQFRLDGKLYHLPRHGFARERNFTLINSTPSSASFRLCWDEKTFENYPFQFELEMHFALTGPSLNILATVKNLENDKTLPASFGFHPAFRWPLPYGQPRAAHVIRFEKDEPAPVRRVNSKGLVLPAAFATPVREGTLRLRDDLFTDDAIIFDPIASQSLRYGADTGPQLEIGFPDTPYLGVWSKPGAPFICIEPWHGHADPQGFSGDLRAKPGIFLVPPGKVKKCAMSIALRA